MKAMTKDCPLCGHLVQHEHGEWQCLWGKSKKPKILDEKRIKKRCWLREKYAL